MKVKYLKRRADVDGGGSGVWARRKNRCWKWSKSQSKEQRRDEQDERKTGHESAGEKKKLMKSRGEATGWEEWVKAVSEDGGGGSRFCCGEKSKCCADRNCERYHKSSVLQSSAHLYVHTQAQCQQRTFAAKCPHLHPQIQTELGVR